MLTEFAGRGAGGEGHNFCVNPRVERVFSFSVCVVQEPQKPTGHPTLSQKFEQHLISKNCVGFEFSGEGSQLTNCVDTNAQREGDVGTSIAYVRARTCAAQRRPILLVVELGENFLRKPLALNQRPQATEKIELVVRDLLLGNAQRRGGPFVGRAFDDQ